ncbi:MAG TPA: acyltransferase [Tepidisphaeraceae bacterium]|nr:acyltransferase [Tepidisphaeraceae bacterium]
MEVSAIPSEAGLAEPRNETIDIFRLFAAASVVFIHAVQSSQLGDLRNLVRFAVPFYLFASFYFQSLSLRRNADRTLKQYILGRFKRLYLPFLAWSAIYLIVRDVERVEIWHLSPVELTPALLWKGSEYHLWFLPFLLAGSAILATINMKVLQPNRSWRWPLIVTAVAAGLAMTQIPMPSEWYEAFDNPSFAYVWWWRGLPSACWAMAFAWFMTMGPIVHSVSPALGSAGFILAVACSIQQALFGIQQIPRALSGFGCILAALPSWRIAKLSTLAKLGRYGYGVYLCHVLPVETLHAVLGRMHITASVGTDLLGFFISFAASIAIVRTLALSPRLAWLNG